MSNRRPLQQSLNSTSPSPSTSPTTTSIAEDNRKKLMKSFETTISSPQTVNKASKKTENSPHKPSTIPQPSAARTTSGGNNKSSLPSKPLSKSDCLLNNDSNNNNSGNIFISKEVETIKPQVPKKPLSSIPPKPNLPVKYSSKVESPKMTSIECKSSPSSVSREKIEESLNIHPLSLSGKDNELINDFESNFKDINLKETKEESQEVKKTKKLKFSELSKKNIEREKKFTKYYFRK